MSVICATLTTAGADGPLSVLMGSDATESRAPFDCVIVDECTQVLLRVCCSTVN